MKRLAMKPWTRGRLSVVWLLAVLIAVYVFLGGAGSVMASGSLEWNYQTIPNTSLRYVVYGEDSFVAVGDDIIIKSEAGNDWQAFDHSLQANDIAYGNGVYVAVGNLGKAWSSTDGINWTERSTGALYEYLAVHYDGTRFVAVGRNQGRMVSSDGITWDFMETGTDLMTLNDIVYVNPHYVAVGNAGQVMVYADPLSSGTSYAITDAANLAAVAIGPHSLLGRVVVAIGADGEIYHSQNGGISWTEAVSGTTEDLFDIIWSDDLFLFVAVGANGTILSSIDGFSWEDQSIPGTSIRSIAWDGTRFIATGDNSTVFSSTDGINWSMSQLSLLAVTNNSIRDIAWNGDYSQCVAIFMSGHLATSPDGETWTLLPDQMGIQLHSIAWGGGRYVVVGYNSIHVSEDGLNWSNVDISEFIDDPYLTSVTWGNGLFATTNDWPAQVYTSPDGLNWTLMYESSSSDDLLYSISWINNMFVAVGDADLVVTSADGSNWQEINPPGSPEEQPEYAHLAVTYGHGMYIAASFEYRGTTPYLLSSPDLINWQRLAISPDLTSQLRDITFGDDYFAAVGGSNVLVSADGQEWINTKVTNLPLETVVWRPGQFLIGGLQGSILLADIPEQPDPPVETTPETSSDETNGTPDTGTDATSETPAGETTVQPTSDDDLEEIVRTGEYGSPLIPWLFLLVYVLLISGLMLLRQDRQKA